VNSFKSVFLNNKSFTTVKAKNKFCDHCIKTKDNKFGIIQKIIRANNEVYVYVNEIVYLYSPFYLSDEADGEPIKSDVSIMSLSKNFFLESILNIEKVHLLNLDKENNLVFISQFDGSHLFS
jgi:hypothetical protein